MRRRKSSLSHRDPWLVATAVFELLKGFALLAATAGIANLFHKNVRAHVEHWLDLLRVDPDNRLVGGFLFKLNFVHTKELKELTALGCFYAALFLTEGVGLMLRQRWAEWLTVIATGLFLPVEIYEILREFTILRLALFIANAAIVVFLIYRIRSK